MSQDADPGLHGVSEAAFERAVSWDGVAVPTEHDVDGVAWVTSPLTQGAPHAVICFTPTRAGVALSPVARVLGFAPMSFIPLLTPDSVTVSIEGTTSSFAAFGRNLWSPIAVSHAFVDEARRSEHVLVLMADQAEGPRVRAMPWVPASMIWVARVRLSEGFQGEE